MAGGGTFPGLLVEGGTRQPVHRVWKQEGMGLCRGRAGAAGEVPIALLLVSMLHWLILLARSGEAQPKADHTAQSRAREGVMPLLADQDPRGGHILLRGKDTQKPDGGHVPKPVLNLALLLIKLKYCYNLHLYDISQLTWNLGQERKAWLLFVIPTQMVKLIVKL